MCDTRFLNGERLRSCDLFPVVVIIEGRELKYVKGQKGSVGQAPTMEEERGKFEKRVLCHEEPRSSMAGGRVEGLELLRKSKGTAVFAVRPPRRRQGRRPNLRSRMTPRNNGCSSRMQRSGVEEGAQEEGEAAATKKETLDQWWVKEGREEGDGSLRTMLCNVVVIVVNSLLMR